MRRPLTDIASQVLPLATSLLDRILITALLVRIWGVATFEQWSVLLATVTMLTVLDLGFQISFSNKMAQADGEGRRSDAIRIFRESNTLFALLGLLILGITIAVALSPALQSALGLGNELATSDRWALIALAVATAVRTTASNLMGVYRTTLAFARGTLLTSVLEALRVGGMLLAVVLGGDILAAALATAATAVLGYGLIGWIDIARRSPDFAYQLARPTRFSLNDQLHLSLSFSVFFLPTVVFVNLPVMLIGTDAATGILASFILMRTIANFLRILIQKFTFVLGMELQRLDARGQVDIRERVYRFAATALPAGLGFVSAILVGLGSDIVDIWTGQRQLFDALLMAIMLAPLVLTPTIQIITPLMIYANRPGAVAVAIIAQAAMAVALALFLPIDNVALRLTIAIFGSEVIPLAPIVIARARRGHYGLELVASLIAIGTAGVTGAAIWVIRPVLDHQLSVIAFGAALSIIFAGLMAAWFHRDFRALRTGTHD